jgi:hypothetical protein
MRTDKHLTTKQSMGNRPRQSRQRWRVWIIQIALLCLLALHSIGLLHKHATAAEYDACVACQVVDHQALDVPDAGGGALLAQWLLLFLVVPWHRGVVLAAELFRRPPSRAPPFLFVS